MYYRLKQVDFDGSKKELKNISVENCLKDTHNKTHFSIFPNPFVETIEIEFYNETNNVSIIIFGIDGKNIKQFNFSIEHGLNKIQINLGDLPKGVYFLNFNDGKNNEKVKIVKIN
mgnify:CR=1 FL=1